MSYQAVNFNDPHQQLNEKNAIMINTKDPIYFQQTYEKTLMKQFELDQQKKDHAEK